jgi:hypothetical protein
MVGPILGIRLLPCEGGRSFSGYWREKGPPVHTAINCNLKRDRRGFNQGFNGTEFAICGPGNTSNGNDFLAKEEEASLATGEKKALQYILLLTATWSGTAEASTKASTAQNLRFAVLATHQTGMKQVLKENISHVLCLKKSLNFLNGRSYYLA